MNSGKLDAAIRRRVPAQYNGLARQFFRDVNKTQGVAIDLWSKICLDVKKRFHKKPTIRPEYMIDVNREWKKLNLWTVLTFNATKKRDVTIFTLIHFESARWNEGWDEFQASLAVRVNSLKISPGQLCEQDQPLINISLHSLARRFERNNNHQYEAIVDDIVSAVMWLLDNPDTMNNHSEYDATLKIPCKSGIWIGMMTAVKINDNDDYTPLLSIRTFISNEMDDWTRDLLES